MLDAREDPKAVPRNLYGHRFGWALDTGLPLESGTRNPARPAAPPWVARRGAPTAFSLNHRTRNNKADQ